MAAKGKMQDERWEDTVKGFMWDSWTGVESELFIYFSVQKYITGKDDISLKSHNLYITAQADQQQQAWARILKHFEMKL